MRQGVTLYTCDRCGIEKIQPTSVKTEIEDLSMCSVPALPEGWRSVCVQEDDPQLATTQAHRDCWHLCEACRREHNTFLNAK
jgi:hypothetical protein